MKKPTFSKIVLIIFILLLSLTSVGQTLKPFTIRNNVELKGKMLVIGNNILGKDNNPLNDNSVNENISMKYIDIDGDSSTFSSSSAELVAPTQKNGNASTCYRVTYAALYWSAMLQSGSRTDINKVKLKLPGASTYNNITGSVIYDAISTPQIPDNNTPYACYADVTSLLATLPSLAGNYTVADVISSVGTNGSTGLAAGWTLFVIYEDPTLSMKSFTTFDGFAALYDGHFETIPVTGFRTPLSGPVDLQFAYAALEGDKTSKSKLEFGGKEVATPLRGPANNFFNSTIENSWGVSTPRDPSGSNTLGYDTGMLEIKGANPAYIKNNETSTSFMLQGPSGQADPLFGFMGSYAVDIIAPDIKLTKIVKNSTGTDIGGADVNLGDGLYYEINFQNLGNDHVTGMTMTDVLPKNIIFNYPSDLDLTNATNGVNSVTVKSYDPLTRTIVFNVPDGLVNIGDPIYTIRIKAQIVPDCNMLVDACSNEIKNQATATYKGVINTNTFSTDSFSSTGCNFGAATPTNFLVKIDNCKFTQRVVLCNTSVLLTGPNGYDSYVWSRTLGGSSIGTGQTYTATQTGVYYVRATSLSTCLPIDQEVTVVPFGNTVTNPVLPYAQSPYAGSVTTCTINGKLLPNLFLCGANDFRDIKTGITDATSIIWEKLNENGTCPAATSTTICANESASCSWSQVGTGPDYKANTAGQFRLTINYTGGCFSVFYFNVFQNLLNPEVVSKDITCNTQGQITVNGIPASGYEFSLDNGGTGTYQASNVFTNVSAGLHNVYIRQIGVTNACLFRVLNVQILNRVYQVNVNVTQPLCNGGKGSVTIHANNVLPQYYFSIYQGATKVDQVGPINANDYTFSSLNPGTYTVRVWTDDGCDHSENIDIINPDQLTATASLTKPLTCTDGEITVYHTGGTGPYIYYVNSTTNSQNTPTVAVTNPLPAGGLYSITVEDSNNCTATTSITVVATPAPVYTIATTNVLCYGEATGVIQFNVTSNTGGYTLSYSIDGINYSTNPVFSGLAADVVYTPKLRYTLDNGANYCYDTKPDITLTGPSTALTASAGVSELAGCTLSGQGGKLRITNPQGGVAPYLYSFDNQLTWVATNEADMLPGTYTLYIKDANGCIYPMPNVVLDPKPVAPTITIADPVYNCNGSANTTVTVTNPASASYQYGYLLNNSANTNVPSNVFVNVPSGSHTVSVTYKLLTVPTYSNLLNEDFGKDAFTYTPTSSPDGSSPGINSAFCWERQVNATKCNADRELRNGEYTVTSSLRNNFYSGWNNPIDHTTGSSATGGRYLAVDAGTVIPNNAVLYRKTIKDIIPNQPIQVRFFATNLLKVGNNQPDASLTVELQNSSGSALSSSSTGGIPKTNGWVEYNKTIDPGNNTTLDFVLRLELSQVNGIDFAVDDIQVYQLPKTCITQVDFPFVVPTGKAFDASVTGFKNVSCAGANDGEITIAAQNFDPAKGFQYSINNGTTWNTQMTSPYTITGLSPNNYTVLIRYDASSTGSCVKTISQPITSPTALTVTANVTTQPTCTTGATITASAGGGTPAYQYELRNTTGGAVVQAYQTNTQFTNVAAGNYTVFAKDANGCTTSVGAAVNVVAPPTLSASLAGTSDLCYDTVNKATLVVTPTGGTAPLTYSLNGQAGQSSNTFTDVGPGTHSIVVTDSKNCTATINNIVIANELLASTNVSKSLDCSTSPNANIDVTIAGGTAAYTYKVKVGTGSYGGSTNVTGNTFTHPTGTAGAYTFEITDSKGCVTITTATINAITNPTASGNGTDPSCNNGTDGQIEIIGAGGSGGFTYSFNGGSFTAPSINTGLNAYVGAINTKDYTYQVKDSNGCLSPVYTITLNNPTKVVASANIPVNTTCSTTTIITVSGAGGAGGYSYSFNGSPTYTSTNTLTVTNTTAAQSITYSVKDSKGCIDTQTITIPAFNPPTGITFSTPAAITCLATTTSITLTPVGGIAPFTYTIVSGPTTNTTGASSGTFTGLQPGNYVFQVTDANNCTEQASITINPAPIIAVSGAKTDVKCFGATDGTATFTITGASASGNYNYTLSPNSGTVTKTGNVITVTGLAANTYTLSVTDITTGCSSNVASVTINPATQIAFTLAATNINCNNKISTISFPTLSGGAPGYTYAFVTAGSAAPSTSAYSTSTTVDTAVLSTSIDVYVKDTNGCFEKRTITINTDPTPSVTASVSNQCSGTGSNFTITAMGTGGVGTLTYGINGATGAFQSGNTFTVSPGTYTVWVKDANGCTASAAAPITVSPQLTSSSAVTKALDCSGSPDAVITTTITGGNSPYTYTVQKGSGAVSTPSSPSASLTFTYSVSNANADTYTFVITDANGCISTATATVNPITNPTVTATPTQVSCNGGTNGSVTLLGSGGSGGYTYSFNGSVFTATATYSGLSAGIVYSYQVKDSKGCVSTPTTITLTQPTQLDATVAEVGFSCSLTNTNVAGTVTINVTVGTGTAPYTYSFNGSGFTGNNVLTLNDNGTDQSYTYQVRDANGCIISGSDTLERLDPPVITLIAGSTITCDATTSTVTVTATNGVGGLQYETIAPSPIIVGKQNSNSFANLTPGDYIFRVTDANGCYATQSYRVNDKIQVTAVGNKLTDVACNGGNTGSARFTVGNAVGTITAQLLNSSNIASGIVSVSGSTYTYTGLIAGNYTFTVTDAGTGCTATVPVSIVEPTDVLSASILSNVNANCNVATSRVEVAATGGTPSHKYSFVTSATTPGVYVTSNIANLDPLVSTSWYAHIIDANGCTFVLPITIAKDPTPSVSASGVGCLGSVGGYTITATNTTSPASGIVNPVTYSINGGASYQSGNTFVVTTAGDYTIKMKDGNGCTVDSNTITVAPQLTLSAVLNKDITCSALPITDAQITLTPTGGSGSFTYASIPNTGTFAANVFTTTTAGNYTFTVTDSTTGCTYTTTTPIAVSTPVNPDITLVTQTASINCKGESTAAISITIDNTKGQSPFVFNVKQYSDGTYTNPAIQDFGTQTSGLPAGFYEVTVTDAKGCADTERIEIKEPDSINFSLDRVPIQCSGGTNTLGSITVENVTGGTAPFKYFITNNFGSTITPNPYLAGSNEDYTFANIIDFGIYTINVVDANGCSLSKQIQMTSPPTDLNIAVNVTTPDCISGGTATVTVGAPVLGNSYDFGIVDSNIAPYTSTFNPANNGLYAYDFIGLTPGVTYSFVVKDNITGCLFVNTATSPIDPASGISAALTPNNVTCIGESDGSVTMTVSGFTNGATSIDYRIFRQQSNVAVSGVMNQPVSGGTPFTLTYPSPGSLPAGQYYVVYTENGGANNGCKASFQFDIKESSINLSVTATKIRNINCNENGVIAAQAKDGTAPYTYQYLPASSPVPDAITGTWTTNTTFTTNVPDDYVVYAKDAYGCIIPSLTVSLNSDAPPTITVPAPICYDGNAFTIDLVANALASASIMPATYSVNGSAFQSSPSFTFNAAGTYNLVIKDGNGCTANVDYEVFPMLNLSAALTKELDCTGSPDAIITLAPTGGNASPTANYTYEVSTNGGTSWTVMPSNIYTAATAGTYDFRVTDANNATICQTTTTFVLDPKPTTVFTTSKTNVTCNGDDNGTITVNVTSGFGPYKYSLDGGVTEQLPNVFTGLPGSTSGINYVVTVRDAKNCTFNSPAILITEPTPLTATSTITTPLTCGTGNVAQPATVTVTATTGTGTGPYQYSFDGGTSYSGTNTYQSYAGITFDVYVKDANGCIFILNDGVNIPALDPPTQMDIAGTPIYCVQQGLGDTTSTVTISNVIKGVVPFTYTILPSVPVGVTQTGNVFAGLTPGDYMFQVTDANGCTFQELYTVKDVTPIAIVGALISDVSCNAANGANNTGSAKFTVTGFSSTGNYTIAVTSVPVGLPFTQSAVSVADDFTLTGLTAGTYTVTVTDNTTGCQKSDSVTLTEPVAITFATAATKVFCSQDISQITVSGVAGGAGVYTYAVVKAGDPAPIASAYANNPVLSVDTNLTDLSWDVYVKDANGCVAVPVTTPVVYNAAPTINPPTAQCFVGSPLTVDLNTLTITYNSTKFYTVNGSPIMGPNAIFNAPGTYILGVKDDNGCEVTVPYTIEKQLLITTTLTKDLYCTGSVNATIDVVITNGVGALSTQLYSGVVPTGTPVGVPYAGSSFTATVSTAGDYYFVTTDSNPAVCTVTSNKVTVSTPATPTFTPAHTDVSCTGGNNGSITVTPANGIAPYTFALTGPVTNNTGDTTGIYTGLIAGSYNVVVTDAYGCTSTAATPIVITEPTLLAATASFPVNTTCSVATVITVVGNGGTPTVSGGYYYSFDNGVTYDISNTFTVNDNATVQTIWYSVKDANGCFTTPQSIVVNPLNKPINLDFALTTAPTCPSQTATVTLTATNGVGPLQYATIAPSAMIIGNQASNVFAGLIPGDYTFQVTDANGCTYQEFYRVDPITNITVSGQLIANMTCNVGDDGKVTFDVSNFSGNYGYSVTKDGSPFGSSVASSTLTTIPLTGLGFGDYQINVIDNTTLCTATASVTVAQPSVVTVVEVSNTPANCTSNALVKVAGGGGTPGYTYAYRVSGSSTALVFSASDTASLNPALGTAWVFYAKDINGCISAPLTVNISTDPLPSGFFATATSLCPNAAGTFDITVNGGSGMGPFEYSIGSGFQTATTFTVSVPKAYNLIVKDKFGCTATFTAVVTLLEPIALQTNITALPSCANNDGTITASATGGSGNYSYQLDGGSAINAPTANFTGLASGSHTIMVTDLSNGCSDSVILNLVPATPVTGFNLNATPVTCNGGNDGTITATMSTPAPGVNDNPIYTYTLSGTDSNGPVNVGPQQGNVFNNLRAGSYTVTVTSGRGCSATLSVPVTEPGLITVPTPTVTPFGCTAGSNAMNFATITVNNPTGGSGTYSIYEFFKGGVSVQRGASNVYTVTDLTGGNYTVTVYDDKGCVGSATVPVITPFIALDKVNVVVNQAINCIDAENITVTATTIGGPATNLQFTVQDVIYDNTTTPPTAIYGSVYSPAPNANGVFTGLPVGNYVIKVRNLDTNCEIQDVHYVNEPNTFILNAVKTSDVVCYGSNEGTVQLTIVDNQLVPTNDAGAFSYVVTGPTPSSGTFGSAGPLTLSGLTAGTYTVTATLTNSPFCTVATSFSIDQPSAALQISRTFTPITCIAGNNDGTISATAIGGWPGGYEFALSGPVNVAYSAQSTFTNLTAGVYTVSVRDSKGCPVQTTVTLVNPTPIAATINVDKPLLACFGDTDATITVQQPVTGGSGNYKYTLEATYANGTVTLNGPQTSNVFANLGVGSYRVSVSDTWNCSVWTNTVVINQPTEVIASLVQATAQTCATGATLTLSAAGGTGPYVYSVDPNFGTVSAPFASSANISVPFTTVPAKYVYYVRDANGCDNAVSNSIDVTPLVPLDFTFENNNPYINCFGDNSGKITATAVGGAGNYVYTLLDASGNAILPTPIQLTPGNFTQLAAGNYILRVTSGVDCQISKPIMITQPNTALTYTPVVTPVTCNGFGNGKLELTAQGGTGVIKFALSPDLDKFLDSGTFLNLNVGHYQAIIQDVNGCNHVYDFDITEPAPITAVVDPLSVKQELCSGEKTGEFALTVVGGNAPYTASIDGGAFVPVPIAATPNRIVFTGLSGGRHLVKIKDANLCESEVEVILDNSVLLDPKENINYDCVNDLPANKVTVIVDSSNNLADVTYSLDSSGVFQSSNVFTNLAPGPHFIMVQHKNGCIDATQTFTIDQIDPLTISLSGGGLNEIVSTVTGGSGVYQFTVNSESVHNESMSSDGKYIYFRSGNYTVTVTDSNGCSISATKYFEFIDIVIPPIFTPNGDGTNDSWRPANTENYPDIKFVVYDRYGRQVGTFGAGQSWDGKYDGTELPMGDYWYVLKLRHNQDDREFVGHFTLYR